MIQTSRPSSKPALTRRRSDNPHLETWHIYCDDVRISAIGQSAGVPTSSDQWKWDVGFYPGMEAGMQKGGSAESFEAAREAFEQAWLKLEPRLTEEDFECWRHDRDFCAWKQRMWAEHCQLPTQTQDGRSRCFCGAEITLSTADDHALVAHRGIGA